MIKLILKWGDYLVLSWQATYSKDVIIQSKTKSSNDMPKEKKIV